MSNLYKKLLHKLHFLKMGSFLCFRRSKHNAHIAKRTPFWQLPHCEKLESQKMTHPNVYVYCIYVYTSLSLKNVHPRKFVNLNFLPTKRQQTLTSKYSNTTSSMNRQKGLNCPYRHWESAWVLVQLYLWQACLNLMSVMAWKAKSQSFSGSKAGAKVSLPGQ